MEGASLPLVEPVAPASIREVGPAPDELLDGNAVAENGRVDVLELRSGSAVLDVPPDSGIINDNDEEPPPFWASPGEASRRGAEDDDDLSAEGPASGLSFPNDSGAPSTAFVPSGDGMAQRVETRTHVTARSL